MHTLHRRAAFCGRNGGDKLQQTLSTTHALLHVMVGIMVLMCRIGVCSGPLAAQAATIPAGYLPFGKYVKVGSTDYISGHELACQPGNDFCGDGTTWYELAQTCISSLGVTVNNTTILTMQDFTSTMCNTFTTPTGTNYTVVGTLIDARDYTPYVIRKYADGHCWMAENLKFGHCADQEWTGSPTHSSFGVIGTNLYGACISHSSYGDYYYSWQAAVQDANSYYPTNYQPSQPRQGLCPTGWYLPTQTGDYSFTTLYTAVGNNPSFFQPGNSFNYSHHAGEYDSNAELSKFNTISFWWTSTQSSSQLAYRWLAQHTNVDIASTDSTFKTRGVPIRCVKQ